MKLNVFGSCNVLNCCVSDSLGYQDDKSWVYISCQSLDHEYKNFGRKSIDNNYLFNSVLTRLKYLDPDIDVILVSWCDISSKLFLSSNVDSSVMDYSMVFDEGLVSNSSWVRSKGHTTPKWDGLFNYQQQFGNPYYDHYFNQYFDRNIALLETWQKASSLSSILTNNGFVHIFTSDSNIFKTSDIAYANLIKANTNWFYPDDMGIVEYINYHGYVNGDNDKHPSKHGHNMLANRFINYYNELQLRH